jgi:hypothetical protein
MELEQEVKSLAVPTTEYKTTTVARLTDLEAWKAYAKNALAEAEAFQVTSDQDYLLGGEIRKRDMERAAAIKALLNPGCKLADKLHKDLVKDRDEAAGPLEEAATIRKSKCIAWENERDRLRQIEQARLDLEAKKKAEEQALELASMLEAAGAKEAAEQVIAEPVQVVPTILPSTPKIQGFSKRRIYSAEVVDRGALLSAIQAGLVPQEAWQPDMQFLNKQAGALKEALVWPGVRVSYREV